jgi:diguanylate cyclase (GGDEF)-like protein/PAS domain S-box-containing protein
MSAARSRWWATITDSIPCRLVAFALIYFLGAELGHLLAFHGIYGDFATYWPPCGLYLASLLVARQWSTRRQVIAAAVAANLVSDVWVHQLPILVSLGFCAANTVEALAGLWAAHRLKILNDEILSVRDVGGLAISAVACSGPAAALVGATALWLGFGGSWINPFREWWISIAVGEVIFTPLFLVLLKYRPRPLTRTDWGRICESAIALACLALLGYAIFHIGERPIAYMTVPVSLWLALRGGTTSVVLGNVILSMIAVWYSARGEGPLGRIEPLTFRAVFIQVFNITASLSSLMLTAVVNERQRSLNQRIASDERLRDLFDNISDLVVVTDLAGQIQFANRAWIEIVDPAASAAGSNLADRLDEDSVDVLQNVLEVLPQAEVLKGIELRVATRDGDFLHLEGSFSCGAAGGAANRVRIIFRDVTSRKESALKLELARQQLEAANLQLRLLAATDGLTGLANRRAFYERLDQECQNAARHDRPLSLILFDVDHFKSFNDTFGHPAGDDALKIVGWLMKDGIRETDVAGRVGGEEFAILLPETDENEALEIAERIRRLVGEYRWPLRRITASLGLATFYGSDNDRELLVEAADQALYQAKRGGRDQTVRAACRRLSSLTGSV